MGQTEAANASVDDAGGDEEFDPIGTLTLIGIYFAILLLGGCTSTSSNSSVAIWSLSGENIMHIHAYEKLWLAASIVLILLLIGSVTYGAVGPGVAMVSDSEQPIDAGALDEDDRFAEPRVEQVGENEYEAYVVAYQYGFDPDPIVVPEDSTVTFFVTAEDVIHGFQVVETNANTMVVPGEVAEITVEVDEQGEYGIICNEYCGPGHHVMEGKLEVVSESEYEAHIEGGDDA